MALLTDYRSGALGRVSLETPETRRTMIANATPVATLEPDEEDEPND